MKKNVKIYTMLKVVDINYSINAKQILKNINLEFQDGEITVITGGNGSGKSTLLNIIGGITKQDSGKVFLDNAEISNLPVFKRSKLGLSFAFQQPVKFTGISVKRLLEIAENKQTNISTACDYLSQVGLCARNYITREFNNELSGGERKRIEIALSLAQNSQNCLFDEPEAGIDMWSFDSLVSIFEHLKKEGKCVVIVTHNEKIIEIADKIIVLNNGSLEYVGNNEKFKQLLPNLCSKLKGGK